MQLKDALEILRPINCIMGSLTVIIGILNTRIDVSIEILIVNILLGVLTYFFLSGSGMVINDIYDVEIDKINRPERPIPRGSITLKQAKKLYAGTLSLGIVTSLFHTILFSLSIFVVILAISFGMIGWIYAARGKKSGFLGNITVGISFSIGLIYGALLNGPTLPHYIYLFFLTSFFLLVSREIIKDCEDIEGDKKESANTLAIEIGLKKAKLISIISQILAIIFFVTSFFTPIINPILFLILMIPGIATVGYSLVLSAGKVDRKEDYTKISLILKVGASLGLIAFLFASWS
jgi:geranylgeranylglycerol-phosphate geranylgeranyltransferase